MYRFHWEMGGLWSWTRVMKLGYQFTQWTPRKMFGVMMPLNSSVWLFSFVNPTILTVLFKARTGGCSPPKLLGRVLVSGETKWLSWVVLGLVSGFNLLFTSKWDILNRFVFDYQFSAPFLQDQSPCLCLGPKIRVFVDTARRWRDLVQHPCYSKNLHQRLRR